MRSRGQNVWVVDPSNAPGAGEKEGNDNLPFPGALGAESCTVEHKLGGSVLRVYCTVLCCTQGATFRVVP